MGLKDIVMGAVKPFTDLYANRQKRLAQESEAASTVERILTEASAQDSAVAGEIQLWKVKNEQTSWKDEYALIVISAPFVVNMVVGAAEGLGFVEVGTTAAVSNGMFKGMEHVPAWWSGTFQAGMLSALGVTLWNKAKNIQS